MLDNLLNPPILFFFLGLIASLVRSDLEIPQPIPKFVSLYLLMAIGLKGGIELRGAGPEVLLVLAAAMLLAALTPLYSFFILKRKLSVANAAAIAATYGSISAVTFITASNYLQRQGIESSGAMVAAMALMESPAIIVGVALYRLYDREEGGSFAWGELARDALLNGSVFLLMGSLVVGALTGERGDETLHPFTTEIFTGFLCFFLLDLGIVAARRLGDLRRAGIFLVGFALLVPLLNALLGLGAAQLLGLSVGDAFLLIVLCASASYIAVPAAVRLAIPAANPSLYLPMALAVTFPFNIVLGLPLYLALARL